MIAPPPWIRPSRRPGRGGARRITRLPSPTIVYLTPWLTIALASIVPGWLLIAVAPVVPPIGYLMLLAWRQLRPGLLPVWAGLPLGFVDDLFSGQPLGSAIVLWSVTLLALDMLEFRFPWRNFMIEWLVAAAMIVTYGVLTTLIANAGGGGSHIGIVLPQVLLGVLGYPVVGRGVAGWDKLRLTRFRVFG